ncbi:hypothetical protein G7Z17_g11607 [Cylindrodendrum hubeiense]|uniref:Zn(2)-C6 fungal-type domain-containing protein n=1 Tax=Cylindrodendrum hubeiense TaxID=595255 RepID=A0A9P5GZ88_9HYPO|nr:hypothetical protein G7Z17_g11607 [Cylindrodendrum hubeiense]
MNHVGSSPPRRPNGRPQACDPCRARKVACDHRQPVCNRCRKRRQDKECIYSTSAPRSQSLRQAVHRNTASALDSIASAESAPSADIITSTLPSPPSGPGYLGFTSHSTVFEETRHSLSLLHGAETGHESPKPPRGKSREGIRFRDLPSPVRQACLYVLQHLHGQPNEQMTLRDNPCEPEGWFHIAVANILRSLQGKFCAQPDLGESELEQIAEEICNNTAQPFRDIHTSPEEWLGQFCGPKLRWESLGLLWAYLERVSDALSALRISHLAWMPDKQSSETALACLGHCVDLSRHFNEGNDLLLDLCRRKGTLESITIGDARVHVQENVSSYKPSLCSENKRRLFAQIFNSDKFTVSFTGRPPLITRRYCSTPLPLDLRDEDLTGDESTLMDAVNVLDERGWNTKGEVYPATLIRARYMITTILDELVEIALDNTTGVTLEHLQNLKTRQLNTVSEFPTGLVYDPENLFDSNLDIETRYTRILVHLAHLQNLFFVERLLLRNGAPDEGNLLITSFDLVTLTIVFWTHKDQFATMRRNFEWLPPGAGFSASSSCDRLSVGLIQKIRVLAAQQLSSN